MDHEQIRQLLTRAQEIESQQSAGNSEQAEIEQIVTAAEESGLSRESVMRALRERVNSGDRPLAPETIVLARGGGRHYHFAKVRSVENGLASLEFLSGPEVTVPVSDVRPLSLLPGERVNCPWPVWGWRKSTVLSYDKENQTVFVTDGWGWNKHFPLADIRVDRESSLLTSRAKYWILATAMTLGGGLIGSILTRLLVH